MKYSNGLIFNDTRAMKEINKIFVIALVVLAAAFTSCISELDPEIKKGDATEALVKLSITTPSNSSPKQATRAVDGENSVGSVNVLVFTNSGGTYRFAYMVEAHNIVSGNSSSSFSAILRTSPESLKLVLVANAGGAFLANTPSFGQTESEIRTMLITDFGAKVTADLPMWGEIELPGGLTADGASLGTTMLRAMARVDVVKNLMEDSYDFDLESIHVFRANNKIQVIPDALVDGRLQVSSPSVPASSTLTAPQLVYNNVADEGNGMESVRMIYIPEAESNTANMTLGVTSVIIGGYFNGENTLTYYRADFDSEIDGHPYGQILRNHRYIFNLVRVWGRGWSTPEEAAENKSTNINVTIESWTDFVTDMVFDGENHFGVSSRKVVLRPFMGSLRYIDVSTDIPSYTIEWADQNGNGLGNAVGFGSEIRNSYFSALLSADGTRITITALQSNENGSSIIADYILVRANRFEILLTINQSYTTEELRPVKVFSLRNNLGYLGTSLGDEAEHRARGLKGLLSNKSNFGPTGTVETSGFLFSDVTTQIQIDNISDLFLTTHDVVYIPLILSQSVLNATIAQRMVNWLDGSDNRFLIVVNDLQDNNKNILDALGIGGRAWWIVGAGFGYTLNSTAATSYFTTDGPFSIVYGTVPSSFTFRKYDVYHSEISISANPGFTPILIGPGGGMVLGMDLNRRILFVGDIDLFSALEGSGATSDNHLTNTTGVINNNASLLLANVWAYIAETVLAGE